MSRPGARRSSAVTEAAWHVRRLGSGSETAVPLIGLHGWGQTGASLVPLAELLPGKDIILFDLPGFGQTPMLAPGAGTADYAEALAIRLPSDRPAILIGHSFGARVALRYAARHPDRLRALILIAGAGLKRRRGPVFRIRAFLLRLLGRLARGIDRLSGTRLNEAYKMRFGSADYRAAGPLRPTFVATVNEDLSEIAASIEIPVLLIYGAEDRETPPEFGRRYHALMPRSELHVLAGFGHLDILGPGRFQCAHLIAEFLKGLS